MTLEVQISQKPTNQNTIDLIEMIKELETELNLSESILYYGYPRYRDEDDNLLKAHLILISPRHGLLIFGTSTVSSRSEGDLPKMIKEIESLESQIFSKVITNKTLRSTPQKLRVNIKSYIYTPGIGEEENQPENQIEYFCNRSGLIKIMNTQHTLLIEQFEQLVATIDGSRSIPRPKKRELHELSENSKGSIISRLESELARFDKKQREGSITAIDGPQRIRGLAGSGKTIVLARKTALIHLENPEATIAYTFHTKSLYQQIRRLITKFYRNDYDEDPNWDRISVLHSWGGSVDPGIYSLACKYHEIRPITFMDAKQQDNLNPFGYACKKILETSQIKPMYDYMFIDEGQDFPPEFVRLCAALTREMKFVYAYDELQSIFQTHAPDAAAIFGTSSSGEKRQEFEKDIVLHKCYRNPREILVCAHAIGFGVYGTPVQMLENEQHWMDVGYEVQGSLVAGEVVQIFRPEENSLSTLSSVQEINEIIKSDYFENFSLEVDSVVEAILVQLQDGLRPDDIVVVVVDDRNARLYLQEIATKLDSHNKACNNIHEVQGVPEFQIDNRVTLTTVHKAKGNEGYAVHVVGADAVFQNPTKTNRNRLFTAMTRAKAWLRVTGVGDAARKLHDEICLAKQNFPYLKFIYPLQDQIDLMRRDMSEENALTMNKERQLENFTDEELQIILEKRKSASNKGKK